MEKNGGRETWDAWPEEHRIEARRVPGWRRSGRRRAEDIRDAQRFLSLRAMDCAPAMAAAKRLRGGTRRVALMGDIPFGVSYYSADVFARPERFALDWSGGAPPEPYFKDDEFTQKWGQNWGIPLYRWDVMRATQLRLVARARARRAQNSFTFSGSITSSVFIASTPFPGGRRATRNFCRLSWDEMLQRTGGKAPHFAPRDDSQLGKLRGEQARR